MLNEKFKELPAGEQQTLLMCLDSGLEYRAIFDEEFFIGVNVFVKEEQIIEQEGDWTYGRLG